MLNIGHEESLAVRLRVSLLELRRLLENADRYYELLQLHDPAKPEYCKRRGKASTFARIILPIRAPTAAPDFAVQPRRHSRAKSKNKRRNRHAVGFCF
jgi:hypothetical protein